MKLPPVAQLDRVHASEACGHRFKSCRVGHLSNNTLGQFGDTQIKLLKDIEMPQTINTSPFTYFFLFVKFSRNSSKTTQVYNMDNIPCHQLTEEL